ncbi:XdhC family protein [Paracoccus aerius]
MIRVRVIQALGSTPRDAGAEMFVGPASVDGTIGGGQLEYMAIDRARAMLASGESQAQMDIPLGPEIGQCCGGRVVLQLDRQAQRPRITRTCWSSARAMSAVRWPRPCSPCRST